MRPKRHHQVPRAYLNRFGTDDVVRVRWRDGKVYETNSLNVAVETGFYDVPDARGEKSSRVEEALAEVDSAAINAMADVDRTGRPPPAESENRFVLAVFLGLQMTRTTHHREQVMFPERVAKWAGERSLTEALVSEYLRQEHLGFAPRPREAEGAFLYVSKALEDGVLTSEFAVRMMLQMVEAFVPRLLALNWALETDRRAQLITSDTPVVIWRKPQRMDDFEGVGVDNADELRFPLDPSKQLVLSRRRRPPEIHVETHRSRRSNADMAAGSHRFIVGRPDPQPVLDRVHLDSRPSVMRFNVGPLEVKDADGRTVREGEVLHMFVPRRPLGF